MIGQTAELRQGKNMSDLELRYIFEQFFPHRLRTANQDRAAGFDIVPVGGLAELPLVRRGVTAARVVEFLETLKRLERGIAWGHPGSTLAGKALEQLINEVPDMFFGFFSRLLVGLRHIHGHQPA